METASFYKVEVQIGGRPRFLICTLDAAEEILEETGRNPLNPAVLLLNEAGEVRTPREIAAVMAAMLRETEPEVTVKALMKEMEVHLLAKYVDAIVRVIAGPDFGKESEANPPIADA